MSSWNRSRQRNLTLSLASSLPGRETKSWKRRYRSCKITKTHSFRSSLLSLITTMANLLLQLKGKVAPKLYPPRRVFSKAPFHLHQKFNKTNTNKTSTLIMISNTLTSWATAEAKDFLCLNRVSRVTSPSHRLLCHLAWTTTTTKDFKLWVGMSQDSQ